MTRKDGSLALLVVVVWGLNFVVITSWDCTMPPLMLAGLRFMLVAFPALLFVARPAIPLRLLLGYGLTISFGQFAFVLRYRPGYAGGAGVAGAAGASLFYHHSWRLRLWRTLTGQAAGGDRAGDLRRAGAGGREPRRGACPTGGLYADPGGGAQLGLRQYFQQKNHVPGDPPANHIAGGVERIDPGAAVYVCLVADRWPAAHAGESTPDRYADGSLAFYLAFIATLVGYGIWGSLLGRYETWRVAPLSPLVPVVGMASCAAAGGDAERLQLAGAARSWPGSLSTFSVCVSGGGLAWRAGKKKPRRRGYTQVCV